MISFWIRTFFAVQQCRRKQVGTGITQQRFFHTILVFHFPWNIKDILDDPVVGKRYARF